MSLIDRLILNEKLQILLDLMKNINYLHYSQSDFSKSEKNLISWTVPTKLILNSIILFLNDVRFCVYLVRDGSMNRQKTSRRLIFAEITTFHVNVDI
jgi:hypothetical protein